MGEREQKGARNSARDFEDPDAPAEEMAYVSVRDIIVPRRCPKQHPERLSFGIGARA